MTERKEVRESKHIGLAIHSNWSCVEQLLACLQAEEETGTS